SEAETNPGQKHSFCARGAETDHPYRRLLGVRCKWPGCRTTEKSTPPASSASPSAAVEMRPKYRVPMLMACGIEPNAASQCAKKRDVGLGSWLRENAGVPRRPRIAFSSVRCSFENSAILSLLVRGSRLAFRATMCRADDDLEARWNKILTIFDPYTFLHNQGQTR